MPPEPSAEKSIRLDKWLKLSRLCKTRSIATKACEAGKVKINGEKSKASRLIKIGDEITIKARTKYRTVDVLDIVFKNISNKDAKGLYHEHALEVQEESKPLYELLQQWEKDGKRKYKGRPTKKERRDIEKHKNS